MSLHYITYKKILLASFLIIILLLGLMLTIRIPRMGILAVSKIYIEPKGYEDPSTHEWRGSYWVILADTFSRYSVITYKFDKDQVNQPYADNEIGNKTLVPEATIEITVERLKPYWEIPLTRKIYTVYPKVYGTILHILTNTVEKIEELNGKNITIPPFRLSVLETSGSWTLHIPFKITVTKKGDYTMTVSKVIDVVGVEATKPIRLEFKNGEAIYIQLHGQLSTGYGQPTWNDLIIYDLEHVYIGSEVRPIIQYDASDYSYSNYWFGGGHIYTLNTSLGSQLIVGRWSDDHSPMHVAKDNNGRWWAVPDNAFPGNKRVDDDTTDPFDNVIIPEKAYLTVDRDDTNPRGLGLFNYIENKMHIQRVDLDLYHYGVDIGGNALRIYLPPDSYAWLYTLKISTELADTIVYQPIVGHGVIQKIYWASTGSDEAEISDKDLLLVVVKQESSERSRIGVTVKYPSSHPIKVTPSSDSVILDPDQEYTFRFYVENLGASEEITGNITVEVWNDLGETTDTSQAKYKLIPISPEETLLTIYTLERDTYKKISGITVSVQYGIDSQSGVTNNGYITFNLGNYQGTVSIVTIETSQYYSANQTATVSPGQNTVYLYLVNKSSPPPTPWYIKYLWLITILAVTIIISITILIALHMYLKTRGL